VLPTAHLGVMLPSVVLCALLVIACNAQGEQLLDVSFTIQHVPPTQNQQEMHDEIKRQLPNAVSINSTAVTESPNLVVGLCAQGYYCTDGVSTPCPAGTYQPVATTATSLDSCLPCPSGSYCLQAASLSFTNCEPGFMCPTPALHVPCPSNTWSAQGSTNCTLPCPAGHLCSGQGTLTRCKACQPNQFVAKNCTPQGEDTVCSTASCPAGTFGAGGMCQSCAEGTYAGVDAMTTCTRCPQGTYTNATRSTVCKTCPQFTFSNGVKCLKVCPYLLAYYLRHMMEPSHVLHL
jgi:hypothetical protein